MTTTVATLAVMATLWSGAEASAASFVAGQDEPPSVQAAGPGDVDGIRQHVKEGQKVRVIDDQGQESSGRIVTLAPDHLVLLTRDGERRNVFYTAVLRIDRPYDTLANGVLIGFVSGAALGLLGVVADATSECQPSFYGCSRPGAAAYLIIPGLLGGAGAGIGVAIDALIHRDPTLFRRSGSRVMLAPSVGRGVGGVRLSVQW